jgi:hypothetical protein
MPPETRSQPRQCPVIANDTLRGLLRRVRQRIASETVDWKILRVAKVCDRRGCPLVFRCRELAVFCCSPSGLPCVC